MLTVKRIGENRLDIALQGKLDAMQMRTALDELVMQSAGIEHGLMLYDIVSFHLPSLSAIGVELSRLPAMLKLVKQFDRVAVLTDKQWIKTVSELEGALFPGLTIKAFERHQQDQAEAWLVG
ncbi:Protein of unknown function (DUF3478) [Methylophaga frappieri]|uniref:STAS/SEC14 domain-containing protein n=1 Tax=Methylophaga frappieri (strain ATCC BAA-2434 / DSM 25690 / JAM7) TaxID=754477 RepID=I1YHY0_METFJ|nr:STAS/SEC14 domain-containing protein [Methylophaga frappieri]AFJ02523.1 Protein of unknown function (DUF3478) [Methylophaga frappieri]